MYTRQVLGSLVVAGVVGYVSLVSGTQIVAVLSIAVVSFFAVRWTWATVGRTQYWVSRGTKGVYHEHCPDCRSRRYRTSGDWILTCHKCGWKPGLPIVRWVTRSVPGIQFRRSVTRTEAFVAGVFSTVLLLRPPHSLALPRVGVQSPEFGLPAFPSGQEVLLSLVVLFMVVVAVLLALRPRKTYCANCGQYLGRGEPDENCGKCGSNRFTHEDPGVGEKMRIELE